MNSYFVYRYKYVEMKKPKWDAKREDDGLDCLPCSILWYPGIVITEARNKQEAISTVKKIADPRIEEFVGTHGHRVFHHIMKHFETFKQEEFMKAVRDS